jgi:MoxR-like ATPase
MAKTTNHESTIFQMLREGRWDELLHHLIEAGIFPCVCHRILLSGAPGTGKSSWAFHAASGVSRVLLDGDSTAADLLGGLSLRESKGATETYAAKGIATRSMEAGTILVIDEIDKASSDCKTALYSILDDPSIASVTLCDGSIVTPQDGFAVIATTNELPSILPDALLDRFDLVLMAHRPAAGIYAGLPKAYAAAIQRDFATRFSASALTHARTMGVRSMLTVHRLEQAGIDNVDALALVFGPDAATELAASLAVQATTVSA